MPLFAQRISPLRIGLGLVLCACLLAASSAARADGEDPAAIDRITNLNKKALDAYNNLDFEDARKLLKQALDMCSSSGLDKHPIKARTHIHMGVVLIAAKQQELGVKQFRKAQEIQPDIQVTKALANPEIIQAFEEARAGGGGGDSGDSGSQPVDGGSSSSEQPDISHLPVARGKKGRAVLIAVNVSPTLTGFSKIVLAYRAEGAEEFMARDMKRSGNRYTAEIPADATEGNVVQYYVEAEAEDESSVAASGSEEKPYVISLSGKGGGGGGGGGEDEDEDEDSDEDKGKFFLSVLGGTGTGYVTGTGEVNADNKVDAGFARSAAAHIVPEVGYFISSGFRLSLQFRYQVVTGTTPLNLDAVQQSRPGININMCGADHLCSTATYAFAVIARATWIFGSGTLRPYFSFGLGGGQIRHVVTFTSLTSANPNAKEGLCGKTGNLVPCVDTVLSGPIFAGPGGGIIFDITPTFSAVAEVGSLLGFPKFTFHLDGNVGVAAKF